MTQTSEANSFHALKERVFSQHPDVKERYDEHRRAKAFVASVREDLASLRRHKKLRQSDLAQRLGVSQPVISRIESDKGSDPGLETLFRYAEACGMKPVVMFVPSSGDVLDDAMTRAVHLAGAEPAHDAEDERQTLVEAQQAILMTVREALHATLDKTVRSMAEDLSGSGTVRVQGVVPTREQATEEPTA